MDRIGTWSALLLALSGCGAGPVTDDVGDEVDTSSDTSTDDDTTSDTGTAECPAPNPVTASFRVSPPDPLTAICTVLDEVSDGANLYDLTLDCEGTNVTINIDSTIPSKPYVGVGEMVSFAYRYEPLSQTGDHWLAIHRVDAPDVLLLGGVSASLLDPPGTTLGEFFHDPTLSVAADQSCEPSMDTCGESRRIALDVSLDMFGAGDPVFDHGSWFADFLAFGYSIEVEYAVQRVGPINCDDVPAEWFQLLVVWFPSD
jgi:hypothetical protein